MTTTTAATADHVITFNERTIRERTYHYAVCVCGFLAVENSREKAQKRADKHKEEPHQHQAFKLAERIRMGELTDAEVEHLGKALCFAAAVVDGKAHKGALVVDLLAELVRGGA